jgi:hypothetical protein
MREILDFYADKENDKQTVFDFIDHAEVNLNAIEDFFNSKLPDYKLVDFLEKLPAVLRIPMIMKEIHSLNYEKIAELIDVPNGVIATRIYRARKLLYLFLRDNFNYEEKKRIGLPEGSPKMIFNLRQCALMADDELTLEQKGIFDALTSNNDFYRPEILIQNGIKKFFVNLSPDNVKINRIKAKIERKGINRFGKPD